MNENSEIVQTYSLKEDIENAIVQHNKKHYSAALNTPMYQDKIYKKLSSDITRNSILDGTLSREDYDNEEVFYFLSLLKQPLQSWNDKNRKFQPVAQDQWVREVKRAKKQSTSSIFSKRTYAVYKYALNSVRMTAILVALLNIFLKRCYYPQQWTKLVEACLEKGKGPILSKLRYITLIKGDLQIGMRIALNSDEEELIEKDDRFSKANFGSRKNFAITTVLL